MSIQSLEGPAGPPPRTNGTPSGYRNIRVLTPNSLHFRLVAYAGSVHVFTERIHPKGSPPGHPDRPRHGPAGPGGHPGDGTRPTARPQDLIEGPGAALGRGAAQTAEEPSPGHRPGQGPQKSPGLAARPGAAPSPGALGRFASRPCREDRPALSGTAARPLSQDPSGPSLGASRCQALASKADGPGRRWPRSTPTNPDHSCPIAPTRKIPFQLVLVSKHDPRLGYRPANSWQ